MSGDPSFPDNSPMPDRSSGDHRPDTQRDSTADAVRKLVLEEDTRANPQQEPIRVAAADSKQTLPSFSGGIVSMWVKGAAVASGRLTVRFFRRPDAPRLMAIMLLVIIFLAEPWFVLTVFLLAILTALVAYFSLGPDRVTELVVAWYDRLRQRDPDRAATLRHRAASCSKKMSEIVERLPDRWTTGLYLPDFEEPPELPKKMKSDPFDRLAAQIHQQKATEADRRVISD